MFDLLQRPTIAWWDLLDIAIVSVLIYQLLLLIRGTRAAQMALSGVFLIGYGLARSFVELFREPDAHLGFLLGGLTMGQLLSLPMIVLGALLVARSYGRARASLERS